MIDRVNISEKEEEMIQTGCSMECYLKASVYLESSTFRHRYWNVDLTEPVPLKRLIITNGLSRHYGHAGKQVGILSTALIARIYPGALLGKNVHAIALCLLVICDGSAHVCMHSRVEACPVRNGSQQ
jgi:hypothetical protein